MQQYLRKNRLSECLDALGAQGMILLGAVMWFVWLWGLGVPALLAGGALGLLGMLGRASYRRRTVARREKLLRASIGGEMMLEEMLLAHAKQAHFQAALLLAERWPVTLVSVREEGMLCRQGDETLLIVCIRTPPDGELSSGDLVAVQRAVRQTGADRGVICALGRTSPRILARAEQASVPLRIIPRETLLEIAGQLSPATDDQLIALGQRRRRCGGRGAFLHIVFRQHKARRYFLYGLTMLLLYLITGFRLYAVPGMVCLTLAVFCRTGRAAPELL